MLSDEHRTNLPGERDIGECRADDPDVSFGKRKRLSDVDAGKLERVVKEEGKEYGSSIDANNHTKLDDKKRSKETHQVTAGMDELAPHCSISKDELEYILGSCEQAIRLKNKIFLEKIREYKDRLTTTQQELSDSIASISAAKKEIESARAGTLADRLNLLSEYSHKGFYNEITVVHCTMRLWATYPIADIEKHEFFTSFIEENFKLTQRSISFEMSSRSKAFECLDRILGRFQQAEQVIMGTSA